MPKVFITTEVLDTLRTRASTPLNEQSIESREGGFMARLHPETIRALGAIADKGESPNDVIKRVLKLTAH